MKTSDYETHRDAAEAASEKATRYPTVSNHRMAVGLHTVASTAAKMVGEQEQAREHDKRGDFHMKKMQELSEGYEPELNRNFTIE